MSRLAVAFLFVLAQVLWYWPHGDGAQHLLLGLGLVAAMPVAGSSGGGLDLALLTAMSGEPPFDTKQSREYQTVFATRPALGWPPGRWRISPRPA